MKWFHNDKMALGWAIFVELFVHLFFAVQAFLLGGFLGEIALEHMIGKTWADWIGSCFLGIIIAGASFQAFVLGEYMREHVESFEHTAKGNGSYIKSWQQIRFVVAGLELSSLIFRCVVVFTQGDWQQALVVLVLGLVMLWYAFAQAKIIHASVNRPVSYEVQRMRNQVGREVINDTLKAVPNLSIEEKKRIYNGDLTPLNDYTQAGYQRRQEKLQDEEQRREQERRAQQSRERDEQLSQGYADQLLGNPAPRNPIDLSFLDAQGN